MIQECNEKKEGAVFPIMKNIHERIQKLDGMPKWKFMTTYRIIVALGFK